LPIKRIVTSADRIKTALAISLEASLEESLVKMMMILMIMNLEVDP
jgi:hypothetical protein